MGMRITELRPARGVRRTPRGAHFEPEPLRGADTDRGLLAGRA
jgi:hypothetical protein